MFLRFSVFLLFLLHTHYCLCVSIISCPAIDFNVFWWWCWFFLFFVGILLWEIVFELTDVNECRAVEGVCHKAAACTNTIGSFSCACKFGYTGNGTHCEGEHMIYLLEKCCTKLSGLRTWMPWKCQLQELRQSTKLSSSVGREWSYSVNEECVCVFGLGKDTLFLTNKTINCIFIKAM